MPILAPHNGNGHLAPYGITDGIARGLEGVQAGLSGLFFEPRLRLGVTGGSLLISGAVLLGSGALTSLGTAAGILGLLLLAGSWITA